MIEQICAFIHNYFERVSITGRFVIANGELQGGPEILEGQYYRILGSALNDGVHKHGEETLQDEAFEGTVTTMGVPVTLIELASEISDWQDQYAQVIQSPYQSESFGGYSYTKGSGGSGGGNVNTNDWRYVFGSRLNQWRKLA